MKERPILFNTEMVKAILEGRKTQTRRVLSNQPDKNCDEAFLGLDGIWRFSKPTLSKRISYSGDDIKCPFGVVGDRLWVRETFRLFDPDECPHSDFPCGCPNWGTPLYRASHDCFDGEKWKPSIHMPRSASRILLEITSIRVERLQSISKEDAKAEGCDYSTHPTAIEMGFAIGAQTNFRHAWEKIHGDSAWDKNPWVWVIDFKVAKVGGRK